MKIGMFTDTYGPATDGVVTSIGIFKEQLEKLGHEVIIFAPRYPGQEASGPDTYRFENFAFPPYPEYKIVVPHCRALPLSQFSKLGLDLVHVQTPLFLGWLAAYLVARAKIPAVFTYHTFFDDYVHYLPGPRRFYRWLIRGLTRFFCNRFPMVLTPSSPIKKHLADWGVSSRIEVLPTGLELSRSQGHPEGVRERLGIPQGAPFLATAGRLGREKSFDLLLKAAALVKVKHPDFKLVLMGEGPDQKAIMELSKDLGLGGNCIFTGMVPRQQVLDTFAAADMFVFASQSETQGMVVLEALAQGTPAVAVGVLGPAFLLEGDQGGLLARPDAGDLAEKISALLSDKAALKAKRVEALERARHFSAEAMTAKLVAHYREIIQSAKPQPAPAP